MTSNASLLAPLAAQLKAAGLDDLNISLDSVDPATFLHMTGRELAPVIAGIDAAVAAGSPIKLNAVLLREDNGAQIVALVEWARARSSEEHTSELQSLMRTSYAGFCLQNQKLP